MVVKIEKKEVINPHMLRYGFKLCIEHTNNMVGQKNILHVVKVEVRFKSISLRNGIFKFFIFGSGSTIETKEWEHTVPHTVYT